MRSRSELRAWLAAHGVLVGLLELDAPLGLAAARTSATSSPLPAEFLPPQLVQLHGLGLYVDGGRLPRGLCALDVADVRTAAGMQGLLQLTQLQRLAIRRCTLPALQLVQLSGLPQLCDLCLAFAGVGCALQRAAHPLDAAASALRALPLTSLGVVFDCAMSSALPEHVAHCTCLTSLQLGPVCTFIKPVAQMAAAVRQLPALRELLAVLPAFDRDCRCTAGAAVLVEQGGETRLSNCHVVSRGTGPPRHELQEP